MNRQDILHHVNEIFRETLDNPAIVIHESSTYKDVEEWDSLSNFQLVGSIEKQFSIKIMTSEILNWKNVGDICDSIQKRFEK